MRKVLLTVAFLAALIGGAYFLLHATAAAAANAFKLLSAPSAWFFVILASLMFACSYVPSAFIWRQLLFWRGVNVEASESLALLLRTTPAKYLPGNVAQPMGRAAGLALRGSPLPAAMGTLIEEAVLSIGVAVFFGLSVGGLVVGVLPVPLDASVPWLLLGALVVILAFVGLLAIESAPRLWLLRASPVMELSRITAVGSSYAIVMLLVGGSVAFASLAVSPLDLQSGALVFSAFLLSWALGSLVPGAPAGLGVRDGAMVWILTPYFAETAVVIAAVARITTILGDTVAFLVGLLFFSHERARSS